MTPPANAHHLTRCEYRAPGVYALELDGGDCDVVEVTLDVELDINPPYLTVWRATVTCAEGWSCERATAWIAANERAVHDAITDAYETACTRDAWQWAG